MNDPQPSSIDVHGAPAAQLLPVVITRVNQLRSRQRPELDLIAETVAAAHDEVSRTVAIVTRVEARLDSDHLSERRSEQLGSFLLDSHGAGAWASDTFPAPRWDHWYQLV